MGCRGFFRFRAFFFLTILFIVGGRSVFAEAPSLVDEEAAEQWLSFRDHWIDVFGSMAADCVNRPDQKYALFHGCYDWHSSVHAHWAAFRVANVTREPFPEVEKVAARLTPAAIADVSKFLKAKPDFEMPYGRAWLLRLTVEQEIWSAKKGRVPSKPLRDLSVEVAQSLISYFAHRTPDVLGEDYANEPWALEQLRDYLQFIQATQPLVPLGKMIGDLISSAKPVSFDEDANRVGFFSLFGNLAYLVAKSQTSFSLDQFLEARGADRMDLNPVTPKIVGAEVHHLGMNWSRAWAFRAISDRSRDAARKRLFIDAFSASVGAGIRDHRRYYQNYVAYEHWVPQLAVYALTE